MLSSDAAIYIMKKNFVALNTGTGEARILNITTEFTSGYVAVTKANQHLKLNCEVFGNPVPKVKVYRKPNQNGSKFGEEGEEQPLEMSKNITEYRKLSTFHVWANEICGVTDTFRCDAENKNGEDSKYVTVRSNCTRVAKRNVSLIIGLHIVGVTSLLAMATLTMYFLRQRNKEKKWREYEASHPKMWMNTVDGKKVFKIEETHEPKQNGDEESDEADPEVLRLIREMERNVSSLQSDMPALTAEPAEDLEDLPDMSIVSVESQV
nr:hypothetical protein BaRGS_034875 [Batillaria attramentaria]